MCSRESKSEREFVCVCERERERDRERESLCLEKYEAQVLRRESENECLMASKRERESYE